MTGIKIFNSAKEPMLKNQIEQAEKWEYSSEMFPIDVTTAGVTPHIHQQSVCTISGLILTWGKGAG